MSGGCSQGREIESIALAYTERSGGRGRNRHRTDTLGSIRQIFGCHREAKEGGKMLELEVQFTVRNLVGGITERTEGTIAVINGFSSWQIDNQIVFCRSRYLRIASIYRISFDVLQGVALIGKFSHSRIFAEGCAIHQIALGRGKERNLVTVLPKALGIRTLVVQDHTRVGTHTGSDTHCLLLGTTSRDVFFFRTACEAQGCQSKQDIFHFHIDAV